MSVNKGDAYVCVCVSETESCYTAQAALKCALLLRQSSRS